MSAEAPPEHLADVRRGIGRLREVLDELEGGLDDSDQLGTTVAISAGKVRELANRLPQATAWYEYAVSLDPLSTEARARLAIVFLKAGEVERGIAAARAILATEPEARVATLGGNQLTSVAAVLADGLRLRDDRDGAAETFGRALEIDEFDTYAKVGLAGLSTSATNVDAGSSIDQVTQRLGQNRGASLPYAVAPSESLLPTRV